MKPEQTPDEVATSWEQLSSEQIKLYAKDMADLYKEERKLRHDIEAKNRELELRVRELTALNSVFQGHLNMRMQTEDCFNQLVENIGVLAAGAQALRNKVQLADSRPGIRPESSNPRLAQSDKR